MTETKKKKIWQLENDKIYRLEGYSTLYKVWEDHLFYFNNCINDWCELVDNYGLYEEVEQSNVPG